MQCFQIQSIGFDVHVVERCFTSSSSYKYIYVFNRRVFKFDLGLSVEDFTFE